MVDLLGEGGGRQSSAAAEIDRALEEGRLAHRRARRQHRSEQQRGTAIAEIVNQRGLEFRRVLIEQRPHIGLWHRRHLLGAEPHQPQAGAVPILGIGFFRLSKRRDRRVTLAELPTNFAEREPGGSKAGREFRRLQQQIGGGGEIAFQLQIARKIEPPVSHQIAGGQEYSRRHGLHMCRCRTSIRQSIDRELFRKMDAPVKPAHDG